MTSAVSCAEHSVAPLQIATMLVGYWRPIIAKAPIAKEPQGLDGGISVGQITGHYLARMRGHDELKTACAIPAIEAESHFVSVLGRSSFASDQSGFSALASAPRQCSTHMDTRHRFDADTIASVG